MGLGRAGSRDIGKEISVVKISVVKISVVEITIVEEKPVVVDTTSGDIASGDSSSGDISSGDISVAMLVVVNSRVRRGSDQLAELVRLVVACYGKSILDCLVIVLLKQW